MTRKKNNQKVSIIINCYNGEKYLNLAIESVLNQTYKNWEIIFWDNQSTDDSKFILKSYKDKRIKYFYAKKFTNLHIARNLAISKAKGTFICFLDVDDWWETDKLFLQIKKFNEKNVSLVYGNYWLFSDNYIFKKKKFAHFKLPTGIVLNDLLKDYKVCLPTIMIRRSLLKKMKYKFDTKYKIIGDFDLVLKIATKFRFGCVQKPIAINRIHDQNFSLVNRKIEINELKSWLRSAKKGKFGKLISENPNLKYVSHKINYLKKIQNLEKKNNIIDSFFKLIFSFSINNFKIFIKSCVPKFILKRLTIYG